MRNARGLQCKVKKSGSEKKVNEKTYISSIKRVTKNRGLFCMSMRDR